MRKNNVFFQNSFIISPHPLLFCHDVYPDFPKPKEKRYKDVLRKGSADSMGEAGKRCGKRGGKPGSGRPRTAEFRLKNRGVCNFRDWHSGWIQRRRKPVSNGPRRPSEATTASFGPKYCKIWKRAFYGVFRPKKRKHRTSLGKSTDVCPQKYGCFALRSPMFLKSKRPDFELFSSKTRVFQRKLNLSLPFSENQNTTN